MTGSDHSLSRLFRRSQRFYFVSALSLVASTTFAAPPDARDVTLLLNLEGKVDLTFNIHDLNLAGGGPAPIYVADSVLPTTGPQLPPGLSVTRVGNACVQIAWEETLDDPFPEPFDIGYTLVAGDSSRSATGTIKVEQGGDPIDSNTPCDIDPTNSAPVTRAVSTQTQQDTAVAVFPIDLGGASDSNGRETLRLTDAACWANSPPANGVVSRVSDTELTYTPNAGFVGSDSFGYCVTDNPLGDSVGVAGTINVEVQAVGAPELADDQAATVIGQSVDIDVQENDPIGDAGNITAVGTPAQGGTAEFLDESGCTISTLFGFGCIRYTPPPADNNGIEFVGQDSFTYVVSDPNGGTAQATVVVTVEAAPGTPEANEDNASGIVAGVPTEIDVLANDTGSAPLTIIDVTAPSSGTAVITDRPGQTQVITYTADDTFTGNDEFFYTISDNDPNTIDRVGRVTISVVPPSLLELLEPFAQNDTQREVASAIDVVCPALGDLQQSSPDPLTPGQEALLNRCSGLIEFAEQSQDVEAVSSSLQQIAGEEILAQGTTGTRIINTQIRNIGSRLSALRAGARGISAQGLAMNFSSGTLPAGMFFNSRGGGASADDADTGGAALLADSRLGLFINGRVNFGEQDTSLNEAGFDFDTYGITAGADYRFRNNFVLGASVGYADSTVDFNFDGGDLETTGWNYSLYGTYYTGGFYVDFRAGGGNADFDTSRILSFEDARGGVDTVALGKTDGDQTLGSISAGYNFEKNGWVIAPYVGYDYMKTDISAYDETEGAGWELSFNEQEIKSAVVTGGVRVAYNATTGFGVFVPHIRAAFQRELEDDPRTATVRFANDPFDTEFGFTSEVADTDYVRLGAGFSMVFQNGISGFVDYESIQGFSNLTSSTVTAGLRIERRFR